MIYLNDPIDPDEIIKINPNRNIIFYTTTNSNIVTHEDFNNPCLKTTVDFVNFGSKEFNNTYEFKLDNLKVSIPIFIDLFLTDVKNSVFTKVIHNYSITESYLYDEKTPNFYIYDNFSFILYFDAKRIQQKRKTFTVKNEKYIKFMFFVKPTKIDRIYNTYIIQDTNLFESIICRD